MNSAAPLVCVVDDDASIRKSLLRLFRSAGLAAEAFDSARAYLARAPHAGPSCLVLDVQMPELTGLDLQQALTASGREEQVIFITGNGDIPMCAQAMKAGAVDFLPKPFDDGALLAAVERALARSSRQRQHLAEQHEAAARVATLTPRERQVFEGVLAGKLNKQIAADLGTALKTVKVQRGRVMEKLRVTSVADLVRLAQQAGVAPSGS
ncbi:MAG TPA: response regulator [Chthoniobacteraceae bacterium]|nr:response regulator [Chthoniobacteraceae bacterium]